MPSITIELPDSADRAALSFPLAERMRLGTIALSAAFTTAKAAYQNDAIEDGFEETTEEDIAAIREALAEEAAGQYMDGDVFMAELREKRGWKKK